MNNLRILSHAKKRLKEILAKLLLAYLQRQKEPQKRTKEFAEVNRLTPRQIQVTKLLLDGYSYPEIAQALVIAVHTVRCHARRIYILLGAKGRRDLSSRISDEQADLIRRRFETIPK